MFVLLIIQFPEWGRWLNPECGWNFSGLPSIQIFREIPNFPTIFFIIQILNIFSPYPLNSTKKALINNMKIILFVILLAFIQFCKLQQKSIRKLGYLKSTFTRKFSIISPQTHHFPSSPLISLLLNIIFSSFLYILNC